MAFEIAPSLANLEVRDHWAGLRPRASDELPIIGRVGGLDGSFVATGHYRNGILLAPITADLTADALINDKASKYLELFSPERFSLKRTGVLS